MVVKIHKPAVLLLADGTVYHGYAAGKIGTTTGEICFNTGMTGYQEVFTDPSYSGQIIVTTHVHIGNYGTHVSETESSKIRIEGLVCKTFNEVHSRVDAQESIEDYFVHQNIVGISNIDTREVVRKIRTEGAMNAIISSEILDVDELKELLQATPSMGGLELATKVSTENPYEYGNPDALTKIAVLDLGIKTNILRNFDDRDCYCKIFPARTSFEEMEAWGANGYFISNGPGDPAAMPFAIETIKKILSKDLPVFGICLGHQLLASAVGIPTYKMHHGHRGLNHPVKNLITGKCEITSQNHGFGVKADAIENNSEVEVTHLNLNDNTVEGIRLKGKRAFSVQYHPESSPGPHDSRYLFDDFMNLVRLNGVG